MRPLPFSWNMGVQRKGILGPAGTCLRARNSRYVGGDEVRLHALLGRSAFNALEPPLASINPADSATSKRLIAFIYDNGTRLLVLAQGGVIYEAPLGAAGEFTEGRAVANAIGDSIPRGSAITYGNRWYYTAGWKDIALTESRRYAFCRTETAWRRAGWYQPSDDFSVTASAGSGSFGSTTPVKYLYRIYDSTTDTESMRSSVVREIPAFGGLYSNTLTWVNGIAARDGLGTHLRIYRTNLNEPAGAYSRIDGTGNGIALASVVPGYAFVDNLSNTDANLRGLVRADGIEGTIAWAEHGGPIPQARGMTVFQDRAVCWGIAGREREIIWGAKGYIEAFPVDFDGNYTYYQPLQTGKFDTVLTCNKVGNFLMVLGGETIWRVEFLPDFTDPGFSRYVMKLVTDEDGIVGQDAAASFGSGNNDAQLLLYVSRSNGIVLTNGIYTRPVTDFDLAALIEPSRMSAVECVNYPERSEVWIHYTPIGGTANTQAAIFNYSNLGGGGKGVAEFKVTWPVDVQHEAACFGLAGDGIGRYYVAGTRGRVFVQDSGAVDAQKNSNVAGDIAVEWVSTGVMPAGQSDRVQAYRGFAYGSSGTKRKFTTKFYALDGDEENVYQHSVGIGAGETSDLFECGLAGQRIRVELSYLGPTGTNYLDEDAAQAPCIRIVEVEVEAAGRQARTRV